MATDLLDLLEAQLPEVPSTHDSSSSSWWSAAAGDVAAGLLKLLLQTALAAGGSGSSSVLSGVLLLLQRAVGLLPGVLVGQLPLLGVLLMALPGTQVNLGRWGGVYGRGKMGLRGREVDTKGVWGEEGV